MPVLTEAVRIVEEFPRRGGFHMVQEHKVRTRQVVHMDLRLDGQALAHVARVAMLQGKACQFGNLYR